MEANERTVTLKWTTASYKLGRFETNNVPIGMEYLGYRMFIEMKWRRWRQSRETKTVIRILIESEMKMKQKQQIIRTTNEGIRQHTEFLCLQSFPYEEKYAIEFWFVRNSFVFFVCGFYGFGQSTKVDSIQFYIKPKRTLEPFVWSVAKNKKFFRKWTCERRNKSKRWLNSMAWMWLQIIKMQRICWQIKCIFAFVIFFFFWSGTKLFRISNSNL